MATSDEQPTVKERIKLFQGSSKPTIQPTVATQDTDRLLKHAHETMKNEESLFKEPLQLIYTDDTGKLRCDEKTMKLLSRVNQPLNVVAITGLFRTGKSYLLNRLVGEKRGFKTGNKVHACTKGIWIWCRHHPTQEGQVLVLLDVEGFGDPEKANRKEDTWLFTLATVLSSTLVYNNKGLLDAYALDRLNFLEEIDSTIQISQEMEEDKRLLDFDFFFPSFVITLRDFDLEMVNKSDNPITPDEYLEERLEQKVRQGEGVVQYNKIRLLIRRYFKKRKCFVFIQPCLSKAKLETLADREIEPDFLKSVQEFSLYIFERKPLQLKSGRDITGRMFANLAKNYVNAIGQNKQPSILEATKYMVQTENQAIVHEASEVYKKEMQQCLAKMGDIVPKAGALVDFHELCLSKSLEHFKKLIVFDDEDIYQNKTMKMCKSLLSQFKRICDQYSVKACSDALTRLNKSVDKRLKAGTYNCEKGYDEYTQDINLIVRKYNALTGLGSKSKEILQNYLDNKAEEEEWVYQMAVKAQKSKANTDSQEQRPVQARASMNTEELLESFARSGSFSESLQVKVDKMESDMNHILEERQTKAKKNIQKNYLESLNFRLIELKRQRAELARETEPLKQIEEEITYLQKVFEYAQNVDDTNKDDKEDDNGDEQVPDDRDRIGVRPDAMGSSQENLYQEKQITKQPKRKWCKMQ